MMDNHFPLFDEWFACWIVYALNDIWFLHEHAFHSQTFDFFIHVLCYVIITLFPGFAFCIDTTEPPIMADTCLVYLILNKLAYCWITLICGG